MSHYRRKEYGTFGGHAGNRRTVGTGVFTYLLRKDGSTLINKLSEAVDWSV